MAKQAWYKRLWKRVITAIIAILLFLAGALVWILNAEHIIQGDWSTDLTCRLYCTCRDSVPS